MRDARSDQVIEGLFMILFGSPFLFAGLFTSFEGIFLLVTDGEIGGLFLAFFGLPFMGVGGTMVFVSLRTLGRGLGLIEPKDPALIPRNGPIGPESIQIEHPDSSYSGIYKRQPNIINGKDCILRFNSCLCSWGIPIYESNNWCWLWFPSHE